MAYPVHQVENKETGNRFTVSSDTQPAPAAPASPPAVKLRVDPKTGLKFITSLGTTEPPPRAATAADVAATMAQVAATEREQAVDATGLSSVNEMAAVKDPYRKVWQAGQKGGDIKTGGKITVEGAIPEDPNYTAYQEASTAFKMGLADQGADVAIQQNQQEQAMLAEQAAAQQIAMQNEQARLAAREMAVDNQMAQLDATIQQHQQQWQRGTSTGSELFDGSFGAGNMLSVIGITLAGMGGPEYQANAMNMVNQSLDRAIESQRFAINSMFKQLEAKTGSAEIARESLKSMQLTYAKTMADLYAAKNLTPQIALNLAKLKIDLDDELMATKEKIRQLTIGKVTEQETIKTLQEVKAGWVTPTLAQAKTQAEIDKINLGNVGTSLKLTGADGKEEKLQPGDMKALDEANTLSTAGDSMRLALLNMGLQPGADGKFDRAQLDSLSLKGPGYGSKLAPAAIRGGEEVQTLDQAKQAVVSASNALRKGKGTDAARADLEAVFGYASEKDTANAMITMLEEVDRREAAEAANLSSTGRARYERTKAQAKERYQQDAGDKGLRKNEVK